jgi:large subunit ribosomal protein L4
MKVPVLNASGKEINTIDLPADIFEVEINMGLMHQAYVRQMANARLGTHKTQRRADVSRTSAKWYRQKGTGRARQGAIRAPHHSGGGVVHGPKPRDYTQSMPRKMRRLAVRSALSAKYAEGEIIFIDDLSLSAPRTKEMVAMLEKLPTKGKKTLIALGEQNENLAHSARNLPNVKTLLASYLNVVDLLTHDTLILPKSALNVVETLLGNQQEGN